MTEPAALPDRTEPTLDSTTRADQSDELATTTMLRGAIGAVNTDYYLKIFTRFDAQDRAGPSWNTAAAVATLNWMVFRKMWNAALAYAGIALTVALLVFGIGKLAFHYTTEVQWALAGVYALLLVLIPGLWGNALLFRQMRSDMAGALSANQSIADAAAMLLSRAPTRMRLLVLAMINVVLVGLVLALYAWARDFQGLSGSSALTETTAIAPPAGPVASGNLAVGKAMANNAPAAAPEAGAAASAPARVASAPAAPASASPVVPVAAPAPAASAPAAKASAAASAPSAAASAPAAAASAAAQGTAKAQPPAPSPTADKKPAEVSAPKAAAAKPATAAPQPTPKKAPVTSSAEKAEAAKLAPQASARVPQSAPRAAPKATSSATAAEKARPAAAPDAPGVPAGQFGINVGVFADDNNARNAFIKLSDAGFPAYTQELRGKQGKLTRVRVGPFDSSAEAERSAARIRTMGLDALVFQQGAASR
ncbi:SPOR domain-containing protein [Curvibacter sp. APW13]|uniref:SPOR domain-containing protein n=1 Tax=Curvibacter sp. APW13 TaxID=3077236 RepID=UPI0028DDCC0E|nr:SPOR domain-containing protein [Curvibacter sp. APW13]MDT8992034.1 SPOR domain-containing protein [Curvibacter sp. APW13]